LEWDLKALQQILSAEHPPEMMIRPLRVYKVIYGFGDASGKGFGSTVTSPAGTKYRIGIWEPDAEDNSSNWREFENIVEALEEEAACGNLCGTLVYMFTDNLTCEWLKQTFKASDVVFQVPIGCPLWPQKMFEPLTIGLCFPFISSPP
jgi:hypothetical protein